MLTCTCSLLRWLVMLARRFFTMSGLAEASCGHDPHLQDSDGLFTDGFTRKNLRTS